MSGNSIIWSLSADESLWVRPEADNCSIQQTLPLVVLLRVRNEALILADTLEHIAEFADLVVAYDDASDDSTLSILKSHPKVGLIVQNHKWLHHVDDRLLSETRHRGLLMQEANQRWCFKWCMCCDADERYVGKVKEFVRREDYDILPDSVRISLFDAYLTPGDSNPYSKGEQLLNFRKLFGPERRDIKMLWKNTPDVSYQGLDSREPVVSGSEAVHFFCQHYGKSLSVQHWEDTCNYYVNHFPYEPYGRKWAERKGKAVHVLSDFGRSLYPWGNELFNNAVTTF